MAIGVNHGVNIEHMRMGCAQFGRLALRTYVQQT